MASKVKFPSLPNIGGDEFVVKRPSIIAHRKGKPPENPSRFFHIFMLIHWLITETVDPLLKEEIDQVLATNFQVRNGFLVQAHPYVPPQPLSITCGSSPPKTVVLFTGDGNSITWKSRSLPGEDFDNVQKFIYENAVLKLCIYKYIWKFENLYIKICRDSRRDWVLSLSCL